MQNGLTQGCKSLYMHVCRVYMYTLSLENIYI